MNLAAKWADCPRFLRNLGEDYRCLDCEIKKGLVACLDSVQSRVEFLRKSAATAILQEHVAAEQSYGAELRAERKRRGDLMRALQMHLKEHGC